MELVNGDLKRELEEFLRSIIVLRVGREEVLSSDAGWVVLKNWLGHSSPAQNVINSKKKKKKKFYMF